MNYYAGVTRLEHQKKEVRIDIIISGLFLHLVFTLIVCILIADKKYHEWE